MGLVQAGRSRRGCGRPKLTERPLASVMPARRIFVSANPPPVPPPPPPSLGGTPPSLSLNAPSRGGFLGGRPKLLLSVVLVVLLTGGSLFYLFSRSGHGGGTAQALSL